MNNPGFSFKRLLLSGPGKKDAVIHFQSGLNVITGPTDTGKSFILECLDYLMGAQKINRVPPEAEGYNTLFLEIVTETSVYTLKRNMNGGDFFLYESSYEEIPNYTGLKLKSKHRKGEEDNISAFLLNLNGLKDKEIRKNKWGEKRTLSFRDLSHLLIASENKILETASPFLSSNKISETAEKNILKFLITGHDDSHIEKVLSEKDESFKKGKLELLNDFLSESNLKSTVEDIENAIWNIDAELESYNGHIDNLLIQIKELTKDKNDLLEKRRNVQYRIEELNEVIVRSKILKKHYTNDIERLRSTMEAGHLLFHQENSVESCPLCNHRIEKDSYEGNDLEKIIQACSLELQKIGLLISELEKSQKEILDEHFGLKDEQRKLQLRLNDIDSHLSSDIQTELAEKRELTEKMLEERDELIQELIQVRYQNKFRDYKLRLESVQTKDEDSYANLDNSTLGRLADKIYDILQACNYPELGSIVFEEREVDFSIGGKARKLSGKGKRAITYAVSILALTELVRNESYNLGIPIFDSPLVTYAKPESDDEGISTDLANDFYRYCAFETTIEQIVILENEEPPRDVRESINHIVFEGPFGKKRNAFIPLN